MMAVIETGGKQYKVSPGSVINVEKLNAKGGSCFGQGVDGERRR